MTILMLQAFLANAWNKLSDDFRSTMRQSQRALHRNAYLISSKNVRTCCQIRWLWALPCRSLGKTRRSAFFVPHGSRLYGVGVVADCAVLLCSKSKFSYCVPLAVANTLIPNTVFDTAFQSAQRPINTPQNCAMSVQRRK